MIKILRDLRGRAGAEIFLVPLLVVLIGYMFLGRGFAYLGTPPLYVGEAVLGVGLLAVALGIVRVWTRLSLVYLLLLLFICWGAILTIQSVPRYGLDALRDGVIWGYGLFAILVAGSLSTRPNWLRWLVAVLRWPLTLLVAWIPLLWAILRWLPDLNISVADGVPLLQLKAGDMAVHLGGAAALFGLGVIRGVGTTLRRATRIAVDLAWWLGWGLSAALVSSLNRGGMLAIMAAGVLLPVARPFGPWLRGAALALALVVVAALLDVRVETGHQRDISIRQVLSNLSSIVRPGEAEAALAGSVGWRLSWWLDIVGYTFGGPYFWTGKGFGLNLADDDGYQVGEGTLRSPHNIHMTVLARMGTPGLAVWAVLQIAFGVALVRSAFSMRKALPQPTNLIPVAILAYWLAALVNGTFDVYLEGPQGGIWFWTIFGVGLVWLEFAHGRRFQSTESESHSQA